MKQESIQSNMGFYLDPSHVLSICQTHPLCWASAEGGDGRDKDAVHGRNYVQD